MAENDDYMAGLGRAGKTEQEFVDKAKGGGSILGEPKEDWGLERLSEGVTKNVESLIKLSMKELESKELPERAIEIWFALVKG